MSKLLDSLMPSALLAGMNSPAMAGETGPVEPTQAGRSGMPVRLAADSSRELPASAPADAPAPDPRLAPDPGTSTRR